MNSFWDRLPRPFCALAPMEDVTDTVFRQIIASVGRPDVFFTEFTNVDLINHFFKTSPLAPLLNSGEGNERGEVLKRHGLDRLLFSEVERPIVAQIWGTQPEQFAKAAKIIKNLGFDGIDINLGCPERKIVKQGGCSALIGQETKVAEIIAAVSEVGLPVSVKTRLGINAVNQDWLEFLLGQNLAALTIHARTASEKSLVPAHWEEIAKAIQLRNSKTLIIGNGDVKTIENSKLKIKNYGVDGVMIGRGIFENVALFAGIELSRAQRLDLFKRHVQLFDKTWGKTKNFQILKKFAKTYIHGYDGASALREQVAATTNITDLLGIIS